MAAKTHQTAIVLVPPPAFWQPIQAIRRKHDRQYRRWMPHVTLVYPFRPREEFEGLTGRLRAACARIEPFGVRLEEFRHFEHGRGSYTLWLAPEPPDRLVQLQALLLPVVPDCDDTARHPDGFTPHLSVGQVRGPQALARLMRELQGSWQPLSFEVRQVSLIWRNPPPDDVFRVDRVIGLGAVGP
jgi:2'-5' RNA ligase